MTGTIEAAGDLATGGLVAGAVEPVGGGRADDAPRNGVCLNCAAALAGPYCHRCGQPEHIHRSLGALWHDIAHGVLHFEGKVWRTLPLLAWRPGELTRRYIHGERARFVSPMALFLFSVFLMFAVISALGVHLEAPDFHVADPATAAKLDVELMTLKQRQGELQAAQAAATIARRPHAAIDRQLEAVADKMTANRTKVAMVRLGNPEKFSGVGTGWAALDRGVKKAVENPNLALYKIQSSAYKFSWALIPISTPFLWLMFAWRRQYKLYDHAVFVTYSLSFMTLLGIVLTIAGAAGAGVNWVAPAATFIPPAHLYRQLRGAYELGRPNALLRTVMLIVFAGMAATAFVLLLLTLGLIG